MVGYQLEGIVVACQNGNIAGFYVLTLNQVANDVGYLVEHCLVERFRFVFVLLILLLIVGCRTQIGHTDIA